ncbi:IPT/TIG domain-containing protein [Nocardia sp. CY41]|uniref:IPT/TIG domain-containing protein n=1 Tax=Nocardia sp. CY41 TaxID=2608686 RepID=UPI00135991BB
MSGQHRSTQRRPPAAHTASDPDAALRAWLRRWAKTRPRQGFRRAYHDARDEGLSYAYVPALASIFQFQGPEAGGHLVYLNGSGLTGVTAVTFGSTPATSFTVDSDTEIAVFTPAGTSTVQVTVTVPNGISNGVSYTYVPVPTLTSVNPTSGPEAGGNTVVLTGTGLATGASVRFGIVASDFTVDSDTQITAIAVPGTGTVDITVITAGGTCNGVSYTYA